MRSHFIYFILFSLLSLGSKAQLNSLEISPEKEKMYSPYMLQRHQGTEGLAEFKKNHPHDYLKELWYYSESFYVKRNHLNTGVVLDASIIDISRFETERQENEEQIVVLPGFKDAIVLLPVTKLIYKPKQ
jgi:hypothetical protein